MTRPNAIVAPSSLLEGNHTIDSEMIGCVVIGRNEGVRLERCLKAIGSDIPCVYVDSGSTDNSCELAARMGFHVHSLDPKRPFTASRARAEGYDFLRRMYDQVVFIQFIDGDCVLEDHWLRKAVSALLEDSEIAAVCGRRRERDIQSSFYNQLFDEEWNTPIGEASSTGGDALFRVSAYEATAGFDPEMTAGEEPELGHRIRSNGWKIMRIDQPMTVHDADVHHFSQWWMRTIRSGFGYMQAFMKTFTRRPAPLYARELARAFGWTFAVPVAACMIAIVLGPTWMLTAPMLWLVQYVRLAFRDGALRAGFLLVGKAGEALGAMKAIWQLAIRARSDAIFYK